MSPAQGLKDMTREIGGGRATSRNLERQIELGNMPIRPRDDSQNENPFRDREEDSARDRHLSADDAVQRPALSLSDSESSGRAMSQMTISTTASRSRPQQVKSMLDV